MNRISWAEATIGRLELRNWSNSWHIYDNQLYFGGTGDAKLNSEKNLNNRLRHLTWL